MRRKYNDLLSSSVEFCMNYYQVERSQVGATLEEIGTIRRFQTMHKLVLHTEMVCLIIKMKKRVENTKWKM